MCPLIFVPLSFNDYHLKVGDELRIVVWKKLDEKALVRPDQKISLPLVGEVSCKGRTPAELSRDLSQKYEADATVMVTKYHSWKDDFKDVVGVIRDVAIVFFLTERISGM